MTRKFTTFHWQPDAIPQMPEPHRHNEIEINFVVSGEMTYLFGGRQVTFEANRFYVFWAAIPHQIVTSSRDAEYYVFHLPLSLLLPWDLPNNAVQRILFGEIMASPADDADGYYQALSQRWYRYLQLDGGEYHRIFMLEVEARVRDLALSMQQAGEAKPSRAENLVTDVGSVTQMARFITEHFDEAMSVGEIAGSAGLHPNYAMQLFKRHTGMTMVAYLTQYRLAQAQRLLLTSEKDVLNIAFEVGFSSQSRFYDAFTKACNLSPARYRKTMRQKRAVISAIAPLMMALDE